MTEYNMQFDNDFPMRMARVFIKDGKVKAIKFGSIGWKWIFSEFEKTERNPTEIFLNRLASFLRNLGYSDLQIGRWIFEEAVDHYVAIQLKVAAHYAKTKGKVPKWIFVPGNIGAYRE